jgi:hypothetical protein
MEQKIAYDDRIIIETKEKNEFESYIFDMRDKLSSQGVLLNYLYPAKIQPYLQELAKGEEWLYGEGQNQGKQQKKVLDFCSALMKKRPRNSNL